MRYLVILLSILLLTGCDNNTDIQNTVQSTEVSTEASETSTEDPEESFNISQITDIEEVRNICNSELHEEYDDFDEIYRYYAATITNSTKYFEFKITPYLSYNTKNNNCQLFVSINYTGDNWMFLKSMKLKTDDNMYSIDFPRTSTDVGYGKVYESVQVPVDVISYYAFRDMINCDSCTIRILGQDTYHDITFDSDIIEEFRKVISAYNKLCGLPEV